MEGISVIITAYQAIDFIDECLNGFLEQKTKVPYEILVAVDGCSKTLDKVKEYKDIDVYYSKKNVGTFKNRNALAEKAKYDYLLFFDSDDIPSNKIIQKVFLMLKYNHVHQFMFYNFREKGEYTISKDYANGVLGIRKNVFIKENGFHKGFFGMDTELIYRLEQKGYTLKKDKQCLFYRRLHGNNLTLRKDIGLGTKKRIKVQTNILKAKTNNKLVSPKKLNKSYLHLIK